MRRLALGLVALLLVAVGVPGAAALPSPDSVRVYVLVIDGLRPDEVALMPMLNQLVTSGTEYPESRAVMVAETIPNHIAMVTGVYGDRSGIPANDIPNRGGEMMGSQPGEGAATDAGNPALLRVDSIFSLAERQCPNLRTAAVTSKDYLYTAMEHDRTGDGRRDADSNFNNTEDPTFIPGFGLTPDPRTMTEAIRVSQQEDPDFLFINLGDVDRVGHVDETGAVRPVVTGFPPVGRTAALLETDAEIRRLVIELMLSGKWDSTRLLITADHSMDWSMPNSMVSVFSRLQSDPALRGKVVVAQNGGASLFALRAGVPVADRPALIAKMRSLITTLPPTGLDEVLYVERNDVDGGDQHWVGRVHPDWHLTDASRVGDLILTVKSGFRTSEPGTFSNPIPGNHGHIPTLPIFTAVAGGAGVVNQTVSAPADTPDVARLENQAENTDIGATAAWLLGLDPPTGGFDGRPLTEAFTSQPADACAIASVSGNPAPVIPEAPVAVLLPLAAATVAGGTWWLRRRRAAGAIDSAPAAA